MLHNFLYSEYSGWIIARVIATLLSTLFVTKIFRIIWGIFGRNTIYQKFIKNVLSAVIWVVGIVLALGRFPQFADAAAALIAGSGIVAITIGLAAQESLGNAFNGLFISISKPFEVGDRVHLVNSDITGFVEDITIRHTVIRTFMNSRIIVPNSVLNKELIENANFNSAQASSFIDVIISYGSDVPKACEIMANVIGEHRDFVDTRTLEQQQTNPKVPVFVRALGLYGVELRSSMWTASVSNNFIACSDARKNILQELEKERIQIATKTIL
ncbi:MAG: mechanosensitive ion channel family protein [Defluviitaleaceae bacterium]|nr:mechanosensitive ion channel family protein [Defluviitaleaceae bacterium]